jgi:membrane protein
MGYELSPQKAWKKVKEAFEIVKHAGTQYGDENALQLAAGIAYYAIFSIPGVLLIIVRVAGLIYGKKEVKQELMVKVQDVVGENAAVLIEKSMENAYTSEFSVFAFIVGISVLVFSATTVFVAVQNALDMIWQVKTIPRGWKDYLQLLVDRFFSFLLILLFGALFVSFLLAETALNIFQDFLKQHLPFSIYQLIRLVNYLLPLAVLTVSIAITFKVLPNVRLKWKNVWVGSFITAVLLVIGKILISFYLSKSSVASVYGAAGSVVVILLWIYYSAAIYLFGAQIIESILVKSGRTVIPGKNAVKFERKEIIEEKF